MNALRPTLALAKRELRGAFSRWRLVVFLAVWVGAAVLLNWALLPQVSRNLTEIAAHSRQLLAMESLALLLGLCLAVPSIAAVSVTAERDQDTLDQLRLTLLTDRAILRGKAAASMAVALAFLAGMTPIFAVAQFSVGLDNAQIIELVLYVLAFTFMIVEVALACSAIFKRALSSLTLTYMLFTAATVIPAYFSATASAQWRGGIAGLGGTKGYFLAAGGGQGPLSVQLSEIEISPSGCIFSILQGTMPAAYFAVSFLLPVLLGLVASRIARWGLARSAEPKSIRQTKLIKDEQILLARRKSFPYYLIDPLKPRPQIPDGKNAMFVREFRWGLFQRATWMVRGTYAVFAVSLLIFALGVLNFSPDAQVVAFALLIGIFSLAIPAAFGNTFTKEREQGNFDMLRMTLLSAREVIMGKTLGGSAVLAPALGAILLAAFWSYVFLPESYTLAACGLVTMFVCLAEMIALSLFASIISKRTSSAVTLGAVLSLLAVFASYTVVWIIWNFTQLFSANVGFSSRSNQEPWWVTSAISPFSAYKQSFLPNGIQLDRWNFYRLGGEGPDVEWLYGQFTGVTVAVVMLVVSGYILTRYRMRDE